MKVPRCELCDVDAIKSAVIGDIYYKHLCLSCYDFLLSGNDVSSGQAAYNRARDVEDHEADIIQPWSGGQPSIEFIKLYPEQAKQMFSADEINQAERS